MKCVIRQCQWDINYSAETQRFEVISAGLCAILYENGFAHQPMEHMVQQMGHMIIDLISLSHGNMA
jgi:hypothetical protein